MIHIYPWGGQGVEGGAGDSGWLRMEGVELPGKRGKGGGSGDVGGGGEGCLVEVRVQGRVLEIGSGCDLVVQAAAAASRRDLTVPLLCSPTWIVKFLGPVAPSFRALPGHLKFTVRRHKLNIDSLSQSPHPPLQTIKPPLLADWGVKSTGTHPRRLLDPPL